jgi:hypothetical protein
VDYRKKVPGPSSFVRRRGGARPSPSLRALAVVIATLLVGIQTNVDRAWALPPHKTPIPAGPVAPAPGPVRAPAGSPPPIKITTAHIFDDAANLKQWIDNGPGTAAEVWALLKVYHVDPSNVGRNPFLKNIGFLKANRAAPPGGAEVTQGVSRTRWVR